MSATCARRGIALLWTLLGTVGCGDHSQVPVLSSQAAEIAVDRATYSAMPSVVLDSLSVVCPVNRGACPQEELLLAARAPDGTIAVADRIGGVFLFHPDGSPSRQIQFDKNPARRTGFGGHFVALGDSAWRLHRPDDIRYLAFDHEGRGLNTTIGAIRLDYAGSAAGDVIARIPLPATRREGSDLNPLPPFFAAARVWGVTPDERLHYSDAESYSVLVLDTAHTAHTAKRLIVDAPRRPIDPTEIERAAAKFLAMMPASGRFRDAAEADVERRRMASAKHHPVITDIRFTRDGTLFIRGGPDPDDGQVRWDIFSRDFAPRAHFMLDDVDRLLMIDGDSLLISREGPAGSKHVPWVAMRRAR